MSRLQFIISSCLFEICISNQAAKYILPRPKLGHSPHDRSSLIWLGFKPIVGGLYWNDFDQRISHLYHLEDEKKAFFKEHGYWSEPLTDIIDLITAGIKDQPYDTPEHVDKYQGYLKLPLQHWDGNCPAASRATICSGKLIVEQKRSFAPNPSTISQQRLLNKKSSTTTNRLVQRPKNIRGYIRRVEGQAVESMTQHLEDDTPKGEAKGYIYSFVQWLRS